MAFSGSNHADASRSIFNDVGGDHITITNRNIHVTNLSLWGSGQGRTLRHIPRSFSHELLPTSRPEPFSWPSSVRSKYRDAGPTDIAARHILKIVHSLIGFESSDHYRDLMPQLELLQYTLSLTGLAVQAYDYTPLGESLAITINQEVKACTAVLQELLDTIDSYQQGLESTRIRYLWRLVMGSGCVNKLALIKTKLFAGQNSLSQCLKALDL